VVVGPVLVNVEVKLPLLFVVTTLWPLIIWVVDCPADGGVYPGLDIVPPPPPPPPLLLLELPPPELGAGPINPPPELYKLPPIWVVPDEGAGDEVRAGAGAGAETLAGAGAGALLDGADVVLDGELEPPDRDVDDAI